MAANIYKIRVKADDHHTLELTAIGTAAYSRITSELEAAGIRHECSDVPTAGYTSRHVREAVVAAKLFCKQAAR